MARRVPKLRRDVKPRSGGEVIVWRTGMDRLSGSWAVCHHSCRRGPWACFQAGVSSWVLEERRNAYDQSARWVPVGVPASATCH